jgi:hypothetical protein
MITVDSCFILFLFLQIGMNFPDNKRRLSRQLLTDMNVAQLQVIVNHLHTQIEGKVTVLSIVAYV